VRGHDRESTCGVPFPGVVLPRERWSRTRVPLGAPGRVFDWRAAFGRDARRAVDLGCGNGRWVIASAIARPDVDHLGVELVPQAVRFASLRAGQRGLANAKFAWGDATDFVVERCAPGSLDEAHLYHPQPYYEASQRARRQLGPAVLGAIHRALVPGGTFVFQTDNEAFARYARRVASSLFAWRELDGPWPDAPAGRTLREITARKQGLAVVRVEARRLDLDEAEVERRVAAMPAPDFDANRAGFHEDDDGVVRRGGLAGRAGSSGKKGRGGGGRGGGRRHA
jgi:tRNA (guanine-N7-)-methyltransferase